MHSTRTLVVRSHGSPSRRSALAEPKRSLISLVTEGPTEGTVRFQLPLRNDAVTQFNGQINIFRLTGCIVKLERQLHSGWLIMGLIAIFVIGWVAFELLSRRIANAAVSPKV